MVMSDGGICSNSFNINGKTVLLGMGLVISQTLIPTFWPGATDLRRGGFPTGFRSAVLTAPNSSGSPGKKSGSITDV